jgi:hypothetical protein
MVTGSLNLGIDSPGGIDFAMEMREGACTYTVLYRASILGRIIGGKNRVLELSRDQVWNRVGHVPESVIFKSWNRLFIH